MNELDNYFIDKTIKLAKKAGKRGDFPVGALIVRNNKIISKGFNRKEKDNIAIYHAEIIAIEKACKKLRTWHLDDCTLYSSLEPCVMCAGAIIQSRIKRVVYCNNNGSFGAVESKYQLLDRIEVIKVEKHENLVLLKEFFKGKRK